MDYVFTQHELKKLRTHAWELFESRCHVDPDCDQYKGFGEDSTCRYPMIRLLFNNFFKQFGAFGVLHVSFADRKDQPKRRLKWTNEYLFERRKQAFIFLNEQHVMNLRINDNGEIIIRDSQMYDARDGCYEFLRRSKIFGDRKIIVDLATPQQNNGCCETMSMTNALLDSNHYATVQDANILKLRYGKVIFNMLLMKHKSPNELSSGDWRHASLGLIPPWESLERRVDWSWLGGESWKEETRQIEKGFSHQARLLLEPWVRQCRHHMGSTCLSDDAKSILQIYFQDMFQTCMKEAGPDIDKMETYRELKDQIDLFQKAAYEDHDEKEYGNQIEYYEQNDIIETGERYASADDLRLLHEGRDEIIEQDRIMDTGDSGSESDSSAESCASDSTAEFQAKMDEEDRRRDEEHRWSDALTHYSSRINKLPVDHRTYFARKLGRIWMSIVKKAGFDGAESVQIEDPIYWDLDEDLMEYENDMWQKQVLSRPIDPFIDTPEEYFPFDDSGDDERSTVVQNRRIGGRPRLTGV